MATEQSPGRVSLLPLAPSQFRSGSVSAATAGAVVTSLPISNGQGVYLVTVGTSSDGTGTLFANMMLRINGAAMGVLSSYDGELEAYLLLENGVLDIVVIAVDGTSIYHADNLTATKIATLEEMSARNACR